MSVRIDTVEYGRACILVTWCCSTAVYTSKSSLTLDDEIVRLVLGSNRTFTVRSNETATTTERKTRIEIDVEFHLFSYDFESTQTMLSNVGRGEFSSDRLLFQFNLVSEVDC
jgi:hypothetical protein